MYLNKFSVRVVGGEEKSSGYVELNHEQTYKLCLRNSRQFERCDAQVEIDGKDVGTWRIPGCSSITLERPAHDDGKFTFYRVGTREARKAQLDETDPDLGLVKVTFTPERRRQRYVNRLIGIDEVQVYGTQWQYTECSSTMGRPSGAPEGNTLALAGSSRGSSAGAPKSLAGGTGLSGQSHQQFGIAGDIKYDLSQRTVIHLRLVPKKDDGPRPLTTRSNPVPPRLY